MKSRYEIETEVPDPDTVQAVLAGIGFRPVFRYEKYREIYSLSNLEVVLDETPIGVFLEIEGEPREIEAVARKLGYGPGDFIAESYVALFFGAGGQGDMVFP